MVLWWTVGTRVQKKRCVSKASITRQCSENFMRWPLGLGSLANSCAGAWPQRFDGRKGKTRNASTIPDPDSPTILGEMATQSISKFFFFSSAHFFIFGEHCVFRPGRQNIGKIFAQNLSECPSLVLEPPH